MLYYKLYQFLSTFFVNVALGDLFAHYVEAWKSWYSDLVQGSNNVQQHLGQSAINQFL
jgi:transcription factor E2F7/8